MQALVLTEYRKLELQDVDQPKIGPEDVLVQVAACGICGSDVHGYDGSSGRRVPPIIMGHEAAGTIAEVGSSVNRVQIGDRVTFDSTISCGRCEPCRRGAVNLCVSRRVLGVSCNDYRQHGAFANLVAVPQNILYPLPRDMPFEHAAFIEPVSVAVHAVDRLTIQPGERAVVVGSGMIGLLVIQALKAAGCRRVIAVDIDSGRLELAIQVGATETIDSKQSDATKNILELTGGEGADVAVEVVGNAAALSTAIAAVRRGGRIGLVGNLAPEVPFPLQAVVTRELTLYGSCSSAGEYSKAIEMVASGAIQVTPLISAIAPLADGPQWFERLYAREPGLMKVILKPHSSDT
jgi:L-iditol 2-dehydrogenase